MKKIFLIILTSLFMANNVKSDNVNRFVDFNGEAIVLVEANNANIEKDYNFSITEKQLGDYLELDNSDSITSNLVYSTYNAFSEGMLMASYAENEERRINLIFNSIDYALKNMKLYLNKMQYRKFVSGLNLSLYSRGFFDECYMYSLKK